MIGTETLKKDKVDNIPPKKPISSEKKEQEYGGPEGLEPTRYGDWERKGRVSDF